MANGIKRVDRTVQMMKELNTAAAEALETAALKLQAISKEAVSRKYTKRPQRVKTALERLESEQKRRRQARQYFLNLPSKKKAQDNGKETQEN